MQTFQVQITETLQRTLSIQAKSKSEALNIAYNMYKTEDVILDASDYMDTEFQLLNEETERERSSEKSALIQELIAYLISDEQKHYSAFDVPPQDHIYLKLVRLQALNSE